MKLEYEIENEERWAQFVPPAASRAVTPQRGVPTKRTRS